MYPPTKAILQSVKWIMKQSSSQLVAIRNLNLTGQSHFERSGLVVRVSHEFGPQLASHLTPDGI